MDEIIADNRTGFFYGPLTPDALAGKLLDRNPKTRPAKTNRRRRPDQESNNICTAERMVADFTQLFDRLLATSYRRTNNLAILSRILSSPT